MKIYVHNLYDSGVGSLRHAIKKSNKHEKSIIKFSVTGSIKLKSDLPDINTCVSIMSLITSTVPHVPLIKICCNGNEGLKFTRNSSCSKLIGLSISCASNNGIELYGSNISINNCYIINSGKNGLYIRSNNNIIGENVNSVSLYRSNLISGNRENGIFVDKCKNNIFIKNYIGTEQSGKKCMENGYHGIHFLKCENCVVGGTTYTNSQGITNDPTNSVFIIPPDGNLISGNKCDGISIHQSKNIRLSGNFIGSDLNGENKIPNNKNGVFISKSNNIELIGCTTQDKPFVYYNVISGNDKNGIYVDKCEDITIQGNFSGINAKKFNIIGKWFKWNVHKIFRQSNSWWCNSIRKCYIWK